MSSLELYEGLNMKGQSVSVNRDAPKLHDMGFRKRARSLRVIRHPWVVFTEDNYDGHFRIYEGDHFSIPSFEKKISSARLMEEDLDNPELVIYEDTCYRGQTLRLTRPTESFETYGFEGKGLSEIAIKGVWIIYEEKNFAGRSRIIIGGDQNSDYIEREWNNKVNSARPVTEQDIARELPIR